MSKDTSAGLKRLENIKPVRVFINLIVNQYVGNRQKLGKQS